MNIKKDITYTLISWFVMSFLLSAFLGCTRRELEDEQPAGYVSLSFNWAKLETGDDLPTGMQLYFYASDGTTLTRQATASDFSGSLPPGTYQVLAYNSDGKNVDQRNLNSYADAEVYVPTYTRSSAYLSQPSHCYGVGLGTLTVVNGDSCSATMVPRNFIRQTVIKIESGKYANQISTCSGTLSGFSTGAYISSGELIDDSGKLYFDGKKENTVFSTGLSFFGKDTNEKNILHIDLEMTAGSTQFLNVDITSQLKDINTAETDIEIEATIDVLNTQAVLSSITIKPRDEVNGGRGEVR